MRSTSSAMTMPEESSISASSIYGGHQGQHQRRKAARLPSAERYHGANCGSVPDGRCPVDRISQRLCSLYPQ
ncbi:hypothetical protein [Enterococcus faecium]|uniref:hypothetical protein n=1 Tax=Enterococcus faecium TaxID=1352 RepID=UPI001D4940E4|nr:hypothetical protein [Enterococcus faecium]MCD5103817.1 hypothetical protein [Enterococcus faecium]MDK4377266.1 hypothetical protein [Enterococcus faecium]MRI47229.1 hypothetical protein [Enterococcus faecium]NTL97244.1 hypothetical protein [Enterococcus faecium]HAR8798582.1 hypothetical protein [Enterococcus faecium]